jgi:hypothetical protein
MTFVSAIDLFFYRVMGDLGYIIMAVSAGNVSVNGVCVNIFINIIALFAALFVDPTDLTILMSHEAVFLVCCFSLKADKGEQKQYC